MTRQVITWTPARGTESRTWKVCVKVHDPTFTAWFILRCSSLTVAKCAMCGNAGDTLGSIAQAYGTNWMQLWGANIGSVGTVPAYFPASPTGTAAAVVASSTDADAATAAMGFGSFPDGALRLGPTYITSSAIPPALLARRCESVECVDFIDGEDSKHAPPLQVLFSALQDLISLNYSASLVSFE
mmetsp:Transcript_64785/g.173846  ORF Transcript_64785/g.173846 Transcript_64785/m.173846 type:complete len:185 (+) Transcript_64785:573-1127(+)